MFWGCSSLKTAPTVLPCNLRDIKEQEYNYWSPSNAYNSMFYGCKSLTTGPFLPAAPPPFSSNYKDMFRFCYSLTNFGTYYYGLYMESDYDDFQNWLQGIQTTGTLYCRVDAVFSESDIHLPSTWTLSKTLEIPPTQIISHNSLPQSGLTEDDIFNLNPVSNVSGVTFTYSSSNPTVASVDSNGVISALTSGTTTITINASYWYDSVNRIFYKGSSKSVTVNVTAYPNRVISAQTITYTPLPESGLTVGDTHSFNASALGTINYYRTGSNIRFLDDDTISGVSAGSTSVVIEASEYIDRVTHVYYPSASTEINVTVWTTSAQTISYTALPSSGLTVGDSHSLNASAQGSLTYSSSNPSVATVNSNGVINALTSGNTTITITATAYDDNVNYVHYTSATTSVNVEVSEPAWTNSAQTISYTALPQSGLTVGETHNLNASAQGTLSYSSSNSSVASVNSSGVITAVATGSTVISITVSAYDDSVNKIHYTSASTTVSVTVQASEPQPSTPPIYFDASNPGNAQINKITSDGLSGETLNSRAAKTVYFNVDSRAMETPMYYSILTSDNYAEFYDPDGSRIVFTNHALSGVEMRIPDDINKTGTYKLKMPGLGSFIATKATFQIIDHWN
jgi:Bacterial Ig-like domain (group 2).